MSQIVVMTFAADQREVTTHVLGSDHPARVGAEHMALCKIPVGAISQVFLVGTWTPIVGVVRLATDLDETVLPACKAVATAMNASADRRERFDE